MTRKPFNPSIYFIVDPACCGGRDVVDVVQAALAGGVSMVQYRDKSNPKDIVLHNANRLKRAVKETGLPVRFLINDHVDIAKEVGADGVHLGQDDMDTVQARDILGEGAVIGLTAFTEEQIKAIEPGVIDYIGTGPVYTTKTDKGKPVLGPEGLARLVRLAPVPVVGIGGITPDNAAAVIEAGGAGVAMMRAVSEAPDPKEAAERFKEVLKD